MVEIIKPYKIKDPKTDKPEPNDIGWGNSKTSETSMLENLAETAVVFGFLFDGTGDYLKEILYLFLPKKEYGASKYPIPKKIKYDWKSIAT